MQRASRGVLRSFVVLLSVVFCSAAVAQAQSREKYTISAKAGGVNLISGKVTLQRKGVTYSQPLTATDDFETGDVVQTGNDGRVEMLLNPGSYMRVAENSEFALTDTSLESIRIKLIKGSIIVEAAAADDKRLLTEIDTPQTKIAIVRKGLYRINVSPGAATELLVHKGRAVVGTDALKTIKDGHRVTISSSGQMDTAKFDRKQQDAFDFWSKQRAETLVAANRRLSDRVIYSAYSVFDNGWCALANCGAYPGLWIYDPFLGYRTFLPFYSRWSSPYGRSYSNGFGFSGNAFWYPPLNPSPGQSTNSGTRVGKAAPTAPPPPAVIDPTQAPPGRRMPDNPIGYGGLREDRRRSAPPMPTDMDEQRRGMERYNRDRDYGIRSSGDFDRGSRQHSEPPRPEPSHTPPPSPPPSYSPPPSAPSSVDRSSEGPRSQASPAQPPE